MKALDMSSTVLGPQGFQQGPQGQVGSYRGLYNTQPLPTQWDIDYQEALHYLDDYLAWKVP